MGDKISKYYILSGLAALGLGSFFGIRMALAVSGLESYDNWPILLGLHSLLQVHGFVVIYTLGVALLVLPRFLNVPLAMPGVAALSWLAAGLSLCLQAFYVVFKISQDLPVSKLFWIGRGLEFLAVVGFLVVLRMTRKGVEVGEIPPNERRLNRLHAAFMASGVLWLLLSLLTTADVTTSDLILWGFASTYVAGIGLRTHPQMLGLNVFSLRALAASVLIWNLGLIIELFGYPLGRAISALGAAFYLLGLHPFRRPQQDSEEPNWLRYYLLTSYLWLALAIIATAFLHFDSASAFGASARHLLSSGFLLSMMFGMGQRIIPLFEKRPLIWAFAPWVILAFLFLGNSLRVGYHITGLTSLFIIGTSCQLAAIILFVLVLGISLLRKPSDSAPPRPSWLHL